MAKIKDKPQQEKIFIADVKCYATFEHIPAKYTPITGMFIGKIKVAEYYYNGMRHKNDPNVYRIICRLPTFSSVIADVKTTEECRKICIDVAKAFCKKLNNVEEQENNNKENNATNTTSNKG